MFTPQVFDSELLGLDLYGLSLIPEVYFRECRRSPRKGSSFVRILPRVARPVTEWRIASFFDVFGEYSGDGGNTWSPGNVSFRVEQTPAWASPEITISMGGWMRLIMLSSGMD